MTPNFEAAMAEMMAEIGQQREGLVRLQESLSTVTGTATSPKRQMSATVDSSGALLDITFHGNAHRKMTGEELANLIVTTVTQAQQDARRRIWEQAGDLGPPGASLEDFANGQIDWSAAFGDALSVPPILLDLLGSPPSTVGTAMPRVDLADPAGPIGDGVSDRRRD